MGVILENKSCKRSSKAGKGEVPAKGVQRMLYVVNKGIQQIPK